MTNLYLRMLTRKAVFESTTEIPNFKNVCQHNGAAARMTDPHGAYVNQQHGVTHATCHARRD